MKFTAYCPTDVLVIQSQKRKRLAGKGWRKVEVKKQRHGKVRWTALIWGAAYGGLVLALAYCVIFGAKTMFRPLVYLLGMGEHWQLIAGALEQLKKADVSFSYFPALVGAVGGGVWLIKDSGKAKAGKLPLFCAALFLR